MTSASGGDGQGIAGAAGPIRALLQAARDWPWLDTLRTLRQRFRDDRLGLTAGSLTFTTLIALVPLLTVMLAVFSAFPMFAGLEGALQTYFLNNLVPDNIAKPVLRTLTQFTGKARGLGTAGLLLLLATALALVLTIDRTLNEIWRVRRRRSLAQRVLVYWAVLTLGPLALGLSLSLTSYAISASKGLVAALPGGVGMLLEVIQFALLTAATAGLFHYVPNTSVRWSHAWTGALFVTVAFEGAKKALAWYVASVPTYSAVYGTFATLPILLLWIYLGWVIVLFGAVIAAYAPSLLGRARPAPDAPGWRFELALAALGALRHAQHGPQRGLALGELAARLDVDVLVLEPIVDLLAEIDWVARLDEGGDPRHVLICDPAATPMSALVARTLLAPGGPSQGLAARGALEGTPLVDALRD